MLPVRCRFLALLLFMSVANADTPAATEAAAGSSNTVYSEDGVSLAHVEPDGNTLFRLRGISAMPATA